MLRPCFSDGAFAGRDGGVAGITDQHKNAVSVRMIAAIEQLFSRCGKRKQNVDADLYTSQAIELLQEQTAAHSSMWRLGDEDNWSADQNSGRITFWFADGTIAEADIQIVGTFNTASGTFLWSWDHPSIQEPLRAHARLARQFGERHRLLNFTERAVKCTEEKAWEFTAVAARLGGANGAYRSPVGTVIIYMTFGEIKLLKP